MDKTLQLIADSIGIGYVKNITSIGSGASNNIVLLEYPDRKAVLKKTKPGIASRLKNELIVLEHTNGLFGPTVYNNTNMSKSDDCDFIVEEYIEGSHLYELNNTSASLLGNILNKIHSISITDLKDKLERPSWNDYFENRLMSQFNIAKAAAPKYQIDEISDCLQKISIYGKSIDKKLTAHSVSLIHSDLIPLNIIFNNIGCRIIDWELTRIDFPEWDICSILKAFKFTDDSITQFLNSYKIRIDQQILDFVSLMHYSNVVLWRMCSFYCRGENQSIKDIFLDELECELNWIKSRIHI